MPSLARRAQEAGVRAAQPRQRPSRDGQRRSPPWRACAGPTRCAARTFCRFQRSFHLTSIAHIDLQQGRVESALAHLSRGHRAQPPGPPCRRARPVAAHARRGALRAGMGHDALPCLQEAAQLFAQLEDPAAEAEMWSRAAISRGHRPRPSDAREAWERVRFAAPATGRRRGASWRRSKGSAQAIRELEGSPAASIPAFEAALHLASTLGEGRRALALRNTLGILEWTAGRYADALTHYEAALLLVREQGDRAQEALILNSLGVTLTELDGPKKPAPRSKKASASAANPASSCSRRTRSPRSGQVSRIGPGGSIAPRVLRAVARDSARTRRPGR